MTYKRMLIDCQARGSGIERRLRVRRFDCPLIFYRECKGKPGQPITDFWDVWRNALQAARLPEGRLFHDLRRSAGADADPRRRGRVHGHEGIGPQDALDAAPLQHRTERERAEALLRAEAYLSTQPGLAENEKGQLRDIHADGGGNPLKPLGGVGSSGRIRTYNPPVDSRMLYPAV